MTNGRILYGSDIDLDTKVKLFFEYLDNGGRERIPFPRLRQSIDNIKFDSGGKVIPETIDVLASSAMLAEVGDNLIAPYYSDKYLSQYQSLLQKSLFFEQIQIDSEVQFDEIFEQHKSSTNNLYRGVREAKWRLYSSLQRHWLESKLYDSESSYLELLENIIQNGKESFGHDILSLIKEKNGSALNDVSVLSYLQHHGCPTPLLDWTFSFSNALFFALDGVQPITEQREIGDYFSLYFIEESHFQTGSMKEWINQALEANEERELKKKITEIAGSDRAKRRAMERHFKGRRMFDRKKVQESGLVAHMVQAKHLATIPIGYFSDRDEAEGLFFSLENNKNVLNQQGVFTWNASPFAPLEQVGNLENKDNPDSNDNYRFCMCYNIHKSLEPHVRTKLEELGITRDFIYPSRNDKAWEIFERSKSTSH